MFVEPRKTQSENRDPSDPLGGGPNGPDSLGHVCNSYWGRRPLSATLVGALGWQTQRRSTKVYNNCELSPKVLHRFELQMEQSCRARAPFMTASRSSDPLTPLFALSGLRISNGIASLEDF